MHHRAGSGGEQEQRQVGQITTLDLQDLLSWASNKAEIECSSLTTDHSLAVRGVVAKHHIPAKSSIISIPRKMVLSIVAGQGSPMPALVPEKLWKSLDVYVRLCMHACAFTLMIVRQLTAGMHRMIKSIM